MFLLTFLFTCALVFCNFEGTRKHNETMKIYESKILKVIDEPLDAVEEIRLKSKPKHTDEESLFICNVSDIINKHKIWKRSMPRVIPFYGE